MNTPDWDRTAISIPDTLESRFDSIYTTYFFDDEADAEKEIQEEGFEILSKGTGRIVITGGDIPEGTVVKIARNQRGYKDNQSEIFGYERRSDEVQAVLAPPLCYGGSQKWLLMPRCDDGDRDAVKQIRKILEENDVEYNSHELADVNVGYYQEAPCIIDYGTIFKNF